LGVIEEFTLTDASLTLSAGDVLVIYTDGVTDALNSHGEEYGLERLVEAVTSAPPSDATLQLTHLSSHLATFTGDRPPFDDITFFITAKE
jgi:sigma-B regulation protein RsbU (phosphoserine phosphatase)